MFIIKTQDYLSQIFRLEKMCEKKYEEINRIKTMIYGVSSGNGDGERVQGSKDQDPMATSIARLVDLEKQVDGLIQVYIDKRNQIINQIDKMPTEKYYLLLTDIYVDRKPISEIADDKYFNCSEKTLIRIHQQALNEFESIWGDNYLTMATIFD